MLILFETAAGFALFKVLNEGKLKEVDNIYQEFENPQKAQKMYSCVLHGCWGELEWLESDNQCGATDFLTIFSSSVWH